jgi:pyruvate ferredoxin oxidoreductase alpha subunit
LDVNNPVTFGPVALQNSYFEFRIDQEEAMAKVSEEYKKIAKDYEKISGRKYGFFEDYKLKDVEKVLILAGSAAGTAKMAVDKLRDDGIKAGVLKINLFRPFPHQEIAEALKNAKEIIVLDRAQSIGTNPPFYSEVLCSMYNVSSIKPVKSYVYGLGGRDIFQKQIEDVILGKNKGRYIQ